MLLERRQGSGLGGTHQSAIADDVGGDDGGELPGHAPTVQVLGLRQQTLPDKAPTVIPVGSALPEFRCGSDASVSWRPPYVRSAPNSRRFQARSALRIRAKIGPSSFPTISPFWVGSHGEPPYSVRSTIRTPQLRQPMLR